MAYGITREVESPASVDAVFAYLKDATTMERWWNATRVARILGDGEVGTRYRMKTDALGREVSIELTLQDATPPWIVFSGRSREGGVKKTFTVRPSDAGTRVSMTAIYTFKGWRQKVEWLSARSLERRYDAAMERLREELHSLSEA